MFNAIRNFVSDERGEDLIEYGLLAAFIAALAVVILNNASLKAAISGAYNKVITDLNV